MVELRDYQNRAIDDIAKAFKKPDCKGVFLVLPTGAGKTVIFAEILRRLAKHNKKSIVVAHRQELVFQASKKLSDAKVRHGIIMASHPSNSNCHVQVCSLKTLVKRSLKFTPDLIVIDEAHLCKADTYQQIFDKWPNAGRLLVSATPFRRDGQGFKEEADEIVVGATIPELVSKGYLVQALYYTGKIPDNLEQVKVTGGDYAKGQLENLVNQTVIRGEVVTNYLEKAQGRKAVCFAVDINHSKALTQEFLGVGIRAEHIDGGTGRSQRSAILERFKSGETQVLCNVDLLCEGWDEPSIECVILARPTKSEGLYIQQVGRGLRTHLGKQDLIVLDHGGNVERFGEIDLPREYTLEGIKKPIPLNKSIETKPAQGAKESQSRQTVIQTIESKLELYVSPSEEEKRAEKIRKEYTRYLEQARKRKTRKGRPYMLEWAWYQMVDKKGYTHEELAQVLDMEFAPSWVIHQFGKKISLEKRV